MSQSSKQHENHLGSLTKLFVSTKKNTVLGCIVKLKQGGKMYRVIVYNDRNWRTLLRTKSEKAAKRMIRRINQVQANQGVGAKEGAILSYTPGN